ncbi:MAG: hypothetical protein Q7P63_04515 [Verrucomicrobiota bacterium JB022]|nr:hypothetical protein [Verrucomicrobiota bacterium JB022]
MKTLPTSLALAAALALPSALSAYSPLSDTITMTGGTLVIDSTFDWTTDILACHITNLTTDTTFSSWDTDDSGYIQMLSGTHPDGDTEVWTYLGYALIEYTSIPAGTYRVQITTFGGTNYTLDLSEE